jgi:hypothetical protein
VKYGSGRVCSKRLATVTVFGPDVKRVKRLDFKVGKRSAGTVKKAPFRRRLLAGSGRHHESIVARVLLVDGRRATVSKRVPPCARVAPDDSD